MSICNDILTELFREHCCEVYHSSSNSFVPSASVYFNIKDKDKGHLYAVSINDGKLVVHLNGYGLINISFDMSDPRFDIEVMRRRFNELSQYFIKNELAQFLCTEVKYESKILTSDLGVLSNDIKKILEA